MVSDILSKWSVLSMSLSNTKMKLVGSYYVYMGNLEEKGPVSSWRDMEVGRQAVMV